ncbi:cysteine-rich receptor-like protein kinase 25 [Eucalyptus grandis]|uniref:cysteine-rich receptor-like protein kinase 25 n=1 Tax=Eucalyptus grandis TaxID=71139 RepID=UPI00192EC6BA|nr:cysteine-rich receptor-like protein kinase 25 [Eucalyptus grandis]
MNSSFIISLCLSSFFFHVFGTEAAPEYLYHDCPNTTLFTPNSIYRSNLHALLSSLSSAAPGSTNGFANANVGQNPPERAYGLFLCRGDLNSTTCGRCVAAGERDILQRCPNQRVSIIWYDQCMLRYSNWSILSVMEQSPDRVLYDIGNVIEPTRFMQLLGETLRDIAVRASAGGSEKKVAAAEANFTSSQKLYALAQCTPDLTASDCVKCLQFASANLSQGKQGGRLLAPSCNLRYELYPFYNASALPSPATPPPSLAPSPPAPVTGLEVTCECLACLPPSRLSIFIILGLIFHVCSIHYLAMASPAAGKGSLAHGCHDLGKAGLTMGERKWDWEVHVGSNIFTVIIIVVALSVISTTVVLFLAWRFSRRNATNRHEVIQGDRIGLTEITNSQSMLYDLATIVTATNNFSCQNKLGHGGFGEVFLGTLLNGLLIAVKRLSQSSRQSFEEFKNEVTLLPKLQHRNIVQLLGFCLEGEEKLLVYEFVQNKSLDYFLFDPEKSKHLNWSIRYNIACGIARGMRYLHEDSRIRIIHRDMKSSNILLDSEMNPKISDFGMARIFGIDQTLAMTERIGGTYGYMSPEYVMNGQFSVKSDVYSFGVLLLELIIGKKNSFFNQVDKGEGIACYAWKNWRDGTPLLVLDPAIGETYSVAEVARCLRIGLLCAQEDPNRRPTMADIVHELNSYSVTLELPQQPAFCSGRTGRLESNKSTGRSITRAEFG